MRYPAGGGNNAAARVRRAAAREQAAGMFEQARPTSEIAAQLRVSEKSVREWRRKWITGGIAALASSGAGGADCKLDGEQQNQLAVMLGRPAHRQPRPPGPRRLPGSERRMSPRHL